MPSYTEVNITFPDKGWDVRGGQENAENVDTLSQKGGSEMPTHRARGWFKDKQTSSRLCLLNRISAPLLYRGLTSRL